jgi:hypothetical protein
MYATLQKPPADGCCSGCGSAAAEANKTRLPDACNLGSSDFDQRVAAIRDLARRSLLDSRRDALRLHLTYKLAAFAEVEELVAREAQCCAFLGFELRLEAGKVALTITAPASAARTADELFSHFVGAKVTA